MSVHKFEVKPKKIMTKYRRQDVSVEFVPEGTDATGAKVKAFWAWKVVVTRVYEFEGTATSQQDAVDLAKKRIDTFLPCDGDEDKYTLAGK